MNQNRVMTVADIRRRLRAASYDPLPCSGKRPVIEAWQKRFETSDADIDIWSKLYPNANNTGILTRTTPALDLDILNEEAARAAEDLVRRRFEERGSVLVRIGQPPKRAIPFRTDTPFAKILVNLVALNGSPDPEKIECLCDGQQLVVAGIHPDTKQPYRWHGGEPGQIRHDDLPLITGDEARALVAELVELLVRDFGYSRPTKRKRRMMT